jgi:hypothetical protein
MDDLDRSITRREARSPGYRARLAREMNKQRPPDAGKPTNSKSHRARPIVVNAPDERIIRKGKAAGSPPVLTELSAKLSSTAQAMRAALDRRAEQ